MAELSVPLRRPLDRHEDLRTLLQDLRLSHTARTFGETALKAAKEGLTPEAFLYECMRQEWEHRRQQRVERHLRASGLPREKTFQTLLLSRFPPAVQQTIERLRGGRFVEDAVNVIAVGRPGVGKSHVAAAVGHALIAHGHTVLWTTTATLVQRLLAAKRDLRLPQELAKLDRVACLILDDIGYVQQDREEMEVLFTLLAERYERRSVVITTNLVFSDWNRIFKDPMTTMAAVDRVVHHSIILDLMTVASYRAQEAHQQAGLPAAPGEATRAPAEHSVGKESAAPTPRTATPAAAGNANEQVSVTEPHKEGS